MANLDWEKILKIIEDHGRRILVIEDKLSVKGKNISNKNDVDGSKNLILDIVNKITECEESETVQSKVLDQRKAEAKILLCYYISYKYFKNAWLTTGDIEKITTELGVKMDVRNVTNKIKELRQYLESGSVRKKGQPTPYRLNRRGGNHFEKIIYGESN